MMKQNIYQSNRTFVIGGPQGDAGLTGRKLSWILTVVMHVTVAVLFWEGSYKVDRSAAYAARYIAKNIVASGAADKCEIQLAYAIGVSQPVSIAVDTFGTGNIMKKNYNSHQRTV